MNDTVKDFQENNGVLCNPCVERQLLLNNKSNYQKYLNKNNNTNNDSAFFYNQSNEYEQASPIMHSDISNMSLVKASMKSLSNIHITDVQQKESPTNFTTTTTLDTGTTSSSSSSSYYATPNTELKNGTNSFTRNSAFKSPKKNVQKNPVRFDTSIINNNQRKRNSSIKFNSSILLNAYSTPSLASQIDSLKDSSKRNEEIMNFATKQYLLSTASKSTPNLINNLLNNIAPTDICVETVGSNGAKLSLECGITLLVPEDAIAVDQIELIYLAICRNESSKPKLNGKIEIFFSSFFFYYNFNFNII